MHEFSEFYIKPLKCKPTKKEGLDFADNLDSVWDLKA